MILKQRFDSLFSRLFGLFLLAIMLAHVLGFIWISYYDNGPFQPQDRPPLPPMMSTAPPCDCALGGPTGAPPWMNDGSPFGNAEPPPPPPDGPPSFWEFEGPQALFLLQVIALIMAAGYGARQLTRPIRQLSAATERLSTDLNGPPLSEEGPRELLQAARTFNQMQQRIKEQIRLRGRMLIAVSHDLRTPLARMKLRLEQLEDIQLRQRLGQDMDEMLVLLESSLSYIEAQSATEPSQLLDVQALVESLVENAQDNGADVTLEGSCAPLAVQPLALRSCVSNLLSNALRYAGQAQIQLRDDARYLEIRVCDHGPGIPEDQWDAVFEPFYRLESSRNKDSGGTGLGLTIAKEAALRQGGQLHLAQTPGGGLTVVLCLPRQIKK